MENESGRKISLIVAIENQMDDDGESGEKTVSAEKHRGQSAIRGSLVH